MMSCDVIGCALSSGHPGCTAGKGSHRLGGQLGAIAVIQVGVDGDLNEVGGSGRRERIPELAGDRRYRTWTVIGCEG